MPITKFLQELKKLEIQPYEGDKTFKDLRKTHVPFSGSPHKHPYDKDKFILIVDPYSTTLYYEFDSADIEFAEELPCIVNMEGETINMVLVWIKKRSIALRCSPFIVESAAPMPHNSS